MKKIPELLAPAGNMDAVTAAINSGADAIYLGLTGFSARQKTGFNLKELKQALETAHVHNVKVYVAINTLIKENEINALLELLNELRILPIDGLIVQDLGLIWILQNFYPELSLQLSTQASVYGKEGARFFDELGFDRIVLARETSIEEVKDMKNELDTEIKVFNHGALCYAYSGQCHLSSSIGKRSGNRGSCAQPCRKYYTLTKNKKLLKSGFLLSTKDLSTLDRIEEIKNSGADALKIEGRMKTPEYVYAVTKAYRNLLNGNQLNNKEEVYSVFNRDFTDGRLFSNSHNLSQTNPKRRGELIGKVKNSRNGKLTIKLNKGKKLINGDGLSFGHDEQTGMNVSGMKNQKGETVIEGKDIIVLNSNLDLKPQLPVYRSFNKALMDNLRLEALKKPEIDKTDIDCYVYVKENVPVIVTIIKNNEVFTYESNIIPSPAKTKALNKESLERQFSKLGNTAYRLNYFHADIDENLFLSIKTINQLRREAINILKTPTRKTDSFPGTYLPLHPDKDIIKRQKFSVRFDNLEQAKKGIDLDIDEAVIMVKNFDDLSSVKTIIDQFHQAGKSVLLTTPLVIDSETAQHIKNSGFLDLANSKDKNLADGFLIPNFELLELLKDKDCFKEVDSSFNIFNSYSGEILKNWRVDQAVLSDELRKDELFELSKKFPLPVTLNAAGKKLLMVSANCVFDCPVCHNCSNEGYYNLQNQNGDEYQLKVEDQKNYIFNKDSTVLGDALKKQPYFDKFRITLTDESPKEAVQLVQDLKDGLNRENGTYQSGVL